MTVLEENVETISMSNPEKKFAVCFIKEVSIACTTINNNNSVMVTTT